MADRQRQAEKEEREAKQHRKVGACLEWHLDSAVYRAGGVLLGMNFVNKGYEWLLVVKANFDDVKHIAFFSSVDAARALVKAEAQISAGEVKWKKDTWAPKVDGKEKKG